MYHEIRPYIRKANSIGLVTTTGPATADLLHLNGTSRSGAVRSSIIRKILCYNNTGANVTLQFGTRDYTAPIPLFVQVLPDLLAINGLENVWREEEIPSAEFSQLLLAGVLGREGNIYVVSSVAAVLVLIDVDEFGM